MARKPKTFITDLQWVKKCSKTLHNVIEDVTPKGREHSEKIIEFLDNNPDLRRDLMVFYIKAKERLEQKD